MSNAAPPPPGGPRAIIAIGASAGGLDACRKFLDAWPDVAGCALILVQHLDPTHDSLLAALLARQTALTVLEARDGMVLEADHFYIITPGTSLALTDGRLVVSQPVERRGARLPFDVLLRSLAAEATAPRTMAVVLSGTGEDGAQGARALRAAGGFVVAQEPTEADFDGMPLAAIRADAVDLVLPVAAMAVALLEHAGLAQAEHDDRLADIVALLRQRTATDFAAYKPGTLRRRIARRIGIAGKSGMADYLALLDTDHQEAKRLAKDLLIHVTSFFRDPEVFAQLAKRIIPDLIAAHPAGQPLRVWIAGCSTGEETWSIAMLFQEAIDALHQDIRLQVFASDKDPDAIAAARMARYPAAIAAEVSPARLKRFFTREDDVWQVNSQLRALVVFTVQDVLVDPPFSRIDFISCRNLMIYLKPPAQARIAALFHFALRPGGILLLGGAETIGAEVAGFSVLAKTERIWKRDSSARPIGLGLLASSQDVTPRAAGPGAGARPDRLADLCRRLVQQHYAPAAVLVDQQNHCLHSLGPTDRHLRHAVGAATQDLVALARPALRGRLRRALAEVRQPGRASLRDDAGAPILELRHVVSEGEALLLVCFIEPPAAVAVPDRKPSTRDKPRIAALERELDATRAELRDAIEDIERAAEDQRVVNEEALSINEEFQSTNEELLTSKEELQSLNEELTVMNGQLQETLENSRTTSNDLQNVLYSTEQATLFLDPQLCIRFFTPATRALFSVLPGDVGRPLADLRALAPDTTLLDDAAAVLAGSEPLVHDITTADGKWFSRRAMPYRAQDGAVESVVITFIDITARRAAAQALEQATRLAERANAAKSRFLSAASHDLRQPLQTLTLLRDLLAKVVHGEEASRLVALQEPTLSAMTGMLNTLLDINQIESGALRANPVVFPINDLLARLRDEFGHLAEAQGLALRMVPCGLSIRSDPRLLEVMLRNLLSNALKYTRHGRVLLGCRRRQGILSIEVWDTGIGIAEQHRQVIFEEYRQLDNAARQRARGLGLGLSIVQRLAGMLDHPLELRSRAGRGSAFTIAVPLADTAPDATAGDDATPLPHRTGAILVVEDDPDVRDLLVRFLTAEGHCAIPAADGEAALSFVARGTIAPDAVLADFNLPDGMNGLRLADTLRERLGATLPVIILTGDISTGTLVEIAKRHYVRLHKPARAAVLGALLQQALAGVTGAGIPDSGTGGSTSLHVVHADDHDRGVLEHLLARDGQAVAGHVSAEAFLQSYRAGQDACLLVDARLPGLSGFDLLARLRQAGDQTPVVMLIGFGDVAAAVLAMTSGASDFLEKPVRAASLRAAIDRAIALSRDVAKRAMTRAAAAASLAGLTNRQREVMDRVLGGGSSASIAAELGISERTVERHRAALMQRTGATSLPGLARLALAAA